MPRSKFATVLQILFFAVLVRPLLLILFGVNIRRRKLFPTKGPAIVVANHNSHLDTMVLMCTFSLSALKHVRPVAAKDYWMSSRAMTWFSQNIINIIPVERRKTREQIKEEVRQGIDPLGDVSEALKEDSIVVFFPEGTRGEGEIMGPFKKVRHFRFFFRKMRNVVMLQSLLCVLAFLFFAVKFFFLLVLLYVFVLLLCCVLVVVVWCSCFCRLLLFLLFLRDVYVAGCRCHILVNVLLYADVFFGLLFCFVVFGCCCCCYCWLCLL